MDRIDALKIFAQVADMTSYTRAASALRMPKATVSLAVQRLEEELGARLFHRTTRVVRLTQEGEQLYKRSRGVLADFDELVGLFRTRELVGRVRIDMSSSLAKRFFIPMLPSFAVAHPRIEVELSATDRFVDPVREGVDLVIRAGTLADSSLVVHPVGRMTLLNVVSRDYARRRGVPRTLDELDDHFVVGYASASDPEPAAFEWLDGEILRSRPMRCSITVGNTESYTDACFAGLGLVQAPRYTLVQHLSAGTLVEVLPTHRARPLPLSILHAQRRQLSRRARALLDHVAPLLERDVCV